MRTALLAIGCALLATLAGNAAAAPPSDLDQKLEEARVYSTRNPKLVEQRYLSAMEVKARHDFEKERGITFPRLVRGNPDQKTIALTFDDGPHPGYTEPLLEILKKEKVPATFFVVGIKVDARPDLVQREVTEGHEVANHTYHHLRLSSVPSDLIEPELVGGARSIASATGNVTRLYRPPGGEYDNDVITHTKELAYCMVLWTDDPGDYLNPGADKIRERTLRDASNGGIILLHDGVKQTIEVLPDIIQTLKNEGYRFVTCTQMALERGVIDQGGPRVIPSPALPSRVVR